MSRSQFHRLSIAKVRELPDGIAITFKIPEEIIPAFSFTPGQYLTLEATIEGQPQRRTYSICSHHKDTHLEVGIKRIEGGVFSNYALSLKPGDQLNVLPPEGRFTRSINQQNQSHTLLIAAGSGITPCLSIAKSVLTDEPMSRITLLFGNRTISSMMFRADIAALKDEHTARFNAINMLSGEKQDIKRFNGRITGQSVKAMTEDGVLAINNINDAYLCGPMEMVDSVTDTLITQGMNQKQVHKELFTTDIFTTPLANKADQLSASTNNSAGASQHKVTIMLDGAQSDINVDPSTDTVLSAAQSAGIDMPFSCAGGMCCTCRCKVLEGSATMDANFSLADWEIKAGYMLACQARPSSEKLVLDFDSV